MLESHTGLRDAEIRGLHDHYGKRLQNRGRPGQDDSTQSRGRVIFNITNPNPSQTLTGKFQAWHDNALTGGITPAQILWNFVGTNEQLTSSGGCNGCGGLHGTQDVYGDFFLGAAGTVNTNEIDFQGRVFGKATSQSFPMGMSPHPQPPHEPGTLGLIGISLLGVVVRFQHGLAAVEIQQYEFRTAKHS